MAMTESLTSSAAKPRACTATHTTRLAQEGLPAHMRSSSTSFLILQRVQNRARVITTAQHRRSFHHAGGVTLVVQHRSNLSRVISKHQDTAIFAQNDSIVPSTTCRARSFVERQLELIRFPAVRGVRVGSSSWFPDSAEATLTPRVHVSFTRHGRAMLVAGGQVNEPSLVHDARSDQVWACSQPLLPQPEGPKLRHSEADQSPVVSED
mmetsp:Transcript_31170/g.100012  ORF Transcript_31170/g.100012 Transcript_31170/m.100012 type:complete len:208 (-) Transcript_31170:1246-1869(-)